jgi:protein required for attachment to host cells
MTRQTNFDPRWARHGGAFVVVADSARARILRRSGQRLTPQLLELERMECPDAHRHPRELTTDLTGRVNSGASLRGHYGPRITARHGVNSDYDPRAAEVQRFARQLALRLERLARSERIERLVVIAEPRFLGLLREALSEPLRHVITREVPRNLTSAVPQAIVRVAFPTPGVAGGY